MAKTTPNAFARDALSVSERLLLSASAVVSTCRIAPRTIELMMITGLIKRSDARLALTELGRATLDALLLGGQK